MASIWTELKRRNVFKVAVVYIIVGWLLLQISDTLVPALHLPQWFHSGVAFVLILGFPVALIFAWAFELTPEGLKKEKDVDRSRSITHVTGRKLDFVIIALLMVALGYFGYDKFVAGPIEPQDSIKSIAVLAFADLSPEGDQEYFSDGIAEEILNLLAKVPELRVTSRSSSFSFKGQNLDVPTMAARLKVAHVLEGSVRKSGNQLRITAQLIEGVTDTHLWSATYDRTLDNIFQIQDEIAAAVVDALKITLLGKAPKATETNPEAYTLYLQGRHFHNQGTAESNKQAERLLMQALDIDPSFAPAWTELASVYWMQVGRFAFRPTEEGIEPARHAIQQALDIETQYGRAYAILARIEMFYDWDFAAASRHLQQALALDSGDAAILYSVARLNDNLGDIDEAIDQMQQSIARDPVSAEGHFMLGRLYYRANRLEEAADSLQRALLAIENESSYALRLTGTAVVQTALGDAAASDAALEELIDKYATVAAYQVAQVYAFRGEIDHAFDWLDEAYDNRDGGLPSMLLNHLFANLHDDPRWPTFLDKMGLPH